MPCCASFGLIVPRSCRADDEHVAAQTPFTMDRPPTRLPGALMRPVLPDDDVHIWQFDLRQWHLWREALVRVLSGDEIQRAARLRPPLARRQFVTARGLLRHLLAHYTGLAAGQIAFACSTDGKPALASHDNSDLQFNLSHSHGRAVIALARRRAVGVDLERVSPAVDAASLVEQFFTPAEARAVRGLPVDRRREAFFAVSAKRRRSPRPSAGALAAHHPSSAFRSRRANRHEYSMSAPIDRPRSAGHCTILPRRPSFARPWPSRALGLASAIASRRSDG